MSSKTPLPSDALPEQSKFFSQEKLRKSARAGTQLPNPKIEPYGYDPSSRFDHIFPRISLPPLFPPYSHHPSDTLGFWAPDLIPHELYLGDNLSVLRTIPSESIDLIYIDPPFFSNRTYTQIWWDENEIRSFGDIFEDGMPSYLAWLNARLWEMKRVLKNTGSIYVHCDWHASHYIKCEMDKIFGYENFLNEIIWCYEWREAKNPNQFNRKHDNIYYYSKSRNYTFNPSEIEDPMKDSSIKALARYQDPEDWRWFIIRYKAWWWFAPIEKENDLITYRQYVPTGVSPRDYLFYDYGRKSERMWYPTQKPESLITSLIKVASNHGDVVADFFMGWGTTWAVALKLGRRFIGSDISRVAVSVTANRLAEIWEDISGVSVEDGFQWRIWEDRVADIRIGYVGSYPVEKFKGMKHDEFVKFVLGLYGGMAYSGEYHEYIHGTANSKLVISIWDADPESVVSADYVKSALEATVRAYQKQLSEWQEKILQIIGWKFDPQIDIWRRQTTDYLNKQGIKIQIQIVSLGSEGFRERVFSVIGEANIDLKFNRLNAMLSFAGTPYAGAISLTSGTAPKRLKDGISVNLSLIWARPVGSAHLINTQWDMDMRDGRFADREHALNREGKNGEFTALLNLEHTFSEVGEYIVGARVQDSMDGEATTKAKITLTEKMDGTAWIDCKIEKLS